jgi:hypothetical protein
MGQRYLIDTNVPTFIMKCIMDCNAGGILPQQPFFVVLEQP